MDGLCILPWQLSHTGKRINSGDFNTMSVPTYPPAIPTTRSGVYVGDGTANKAIAHGLGTTPTIVLITTPGAALLGVVYDGGSGYIEAVATGILAVTIKDATNFYVGNATNYTNSFNVNLTYYYWTVIL